MNQQQSDPIRQSLKHSTRDGIFYSVMMGFGENFFAVFAIALGAGDMELGLLSSLPLTIGSLSQLFSSRLIRLFKSRKKFVITAALLQCSTYIPIILIAYSRLAAPRLFLVIICFYWVFVLILGPAWSSWMGDLVDEDKRGQYFGKRNRLCGMTAFFSFMAAGWLLQNIGKQTTETIRSFILLFAVALAARLISVLFLSRQIDPPYNSLGSSPLTIKSFIRGIRQSNFGILILFLCLMNFSVSIAGPFFAPYMLKELHLDYLSYTLINSSLLIVKFLFMPVLGYAADRYGSKKILVLGGLLMPLMPIIWPLLNDVPSLIALHIFGGFAWAAFELAAFNFLFDATTKEQRVNYLAFYNACNGLFTFSGALLGGVLVQYFQFLGSGYKLTFLVSGIMRYVCSFIFLYKLKEIRIVEHISYRKLLFKIMAALPGRGFVNNLLVFGNKKSVQPKNNSRQD